MKKLITPGLVFIFIFFWTKGWAGQEGSSDSLSLRFRFGVETEILKRSLWWPKEEKTTSLQAYLALFRLETEFLKGLNVALLGGYSSSKFESLVFRQLPISIDFDVGGLSGSLFGLEISQVFPLNLIAVGGRARFLTYNGQEKKWAIPDLAVEGELKSQPNWRMITIGPFIGHNGYENLFPYLAIQYQHFWGQFTLREIIENLAGTETKDIKTKGKIALSLGANFWLTSKIALCGEATLIPYKGGQDWGLKFNGIFSF
ncbi:MAG: hypothetical protein N3B16_08445 [Candidatus Aminicenantes bacterium]|nr:hypothetical protein [Candidatus Aminicenantes bacterium]